MKKVLSVLIIHTTAANYFCSTMQTYSAALAVRIFFRNISPCRHYTILCHNDKNTPAAGKYDFNGTGENSFANNR